MFTRHSKFLGALLLASLGLLVIGCSNPTAPVQSLDKQAKHADKQSGEAHNHSGWWCAEHGVPEEVCSLCDPTVAADFQKKGDWCADHDRAKSQCFICDPKLKEKFAAQYRAKEGKEPPPIEEQTESNEGKSS